MLLKGRNQRVPKNAHCGSAFCVVPCTTSAFILLPFSKKNKLRITYPSVNQRRPLMAPFTQSYRTFLKAGYAAVGRRANDKQAIRDRIRSRFEHGDMVDPVKSKLH